MRWWGNLLAAAVAVSVACGGGGGAGQPRPSQSAESAVRGFFQAVADSDIARMSTLWGTDKGSAATTGQPNDWQKRMVVTQIYLRGSPYKILSDDPIAGNSNHRKVQVELDRGECKRTVPILAVRSDKDGWLVNSIDLNLAGSPSRPCAPVGDEQAPKPKQ